MNFESIPRQTSHIPLHFNLSESLKVLERFCPCLSLFVMVWSVEFLPSNSAAQFQFSPRREISISFMGLVVYPTSVFYPVFSLAVALTFCWLKIQVGPPLCSLTCLVFWSTIYGSHYKFLTCRAFGL